MTLEPFLWRVVRRGGRPRSGGRIDRASRSAVSQGVSTTLDRLQGPYSGSVAQTHSMTYRVIESIHGSARVTRASRNASKQNLRHRSRKSIHSASTSDNGTDPNERSRSWNTRKSKAWLAFFSAR